MRGRLIVIEGPDGVGKSTLAGLLADGLGERIAPRVLLLREPGTTVLGEQVRTIVKNPHVPLKPRAEALLFAAARAQLAGEKLAPLLADGHWLVLDRFVLSSLVYQGVLHGLDVHEVAELSRFALAGIEPDRVLCLELPEGALRTRLERRSGQRPGHEDDRFDDYSDEHKRRIAEAYRTLARQDSRALILDATRSPRQLLGDALDGLADLIGADAEARLSQRARTTSDVCNETA